jgi:C4-dicarboxylate transporter DctM subunit
MSPEVAGMVGIVVLLVLFILRMPVAFAMALVGVVGFAYLNGTESAMTLLAGDIYDTLSSYPLSVIPMFILMGSMAFASGISQRLYKTCYSWFGQFRGGLTVATVVACSGFAAICGSTAATAATMGAIALPEMKKYGYSDQLATGTVAAAKHCADRLRDPDRRVYRQAVYRRHCTRCHHDPVFRAHGDIALSAQA